MNFEAFHRECMKPFGNDHNCLTAVFAAVDDFRVYSLRQLWASAPNTQREAALEGAGVLGYAQEHFTTAGFVPCDPNVPGSKIGVARIDEHREILCVSFAQRWYARGRRGAARVNSKSILAAWAV